MAPTRLARTLLFAAAVTALASCITATASATHWRPGTATPMRVPLVDAEQPCTTPPPSGLHHPPFNLTNCVPNVPESSYLKTSSTSPASGFAKYKVINPNTATEDVSVQLNTTDVKCVSAVPAAGCSGGPNTDYTGVLVLRTPIRITDHTNNAGVSTGPCTIPSGVGCVKNTVMDTYFDLAVPSCVATINPNVGSTCTMATTFNAAVPGAVFNPTRTTWRQWREITVMDSGLDGTLVPSSGSGCPPTCGSGDETTFQAQGLFTP